MSTQGTPRVLPPRTRLWFALAMLVVIAPTAWVYANRDREFVAAMVASAVILGAWVVPGNLGLRLLVVLGAAVAAFVVVFN